MRKAPNQQEDKRMSNILINNKGRSGEVTPFRSTWTLTLPAGMYAACPGGEPFDQYAYRLFNKIYPNAKFGIARISHVLYVAGYETQIHFTRDDLSAKRISPRKFLEVLAINMTLRPQQRSAA